MSKVKRKWKTNVFKLNYVGSLSCNSKLGILNLGEGSVRVAFEQTQRLQCLFNAGSFCHHNPRIKVMWQIRMNKASSIELGGQYAR